VKERRHQHESRQSLGHKAHLPGLRCGIPPKSPSILGGIIQPTLSRAFCSTP
jgi:hypothetical protein